MKIFLVWLDVFLLRECRTRRTEVSRFAEIILLAALFATAITEYSLRKFPSRDGSEANSQFMVQICCGNPAGVIVFSDVQRVPATGSFLGNHGNVFAKACKLCGASKQGIASSLNPPAGYMSHKGKQEINV